MFRREYCTPLILSPCLRAAWWRTRTVAVHITRPSAVEGFQLACSTGFRRIEGVPCQPYPTFTPLPSGPLGTWEPENGDRQLIFDLRPLTPGHWICGSR